MNYIWDIYLRATEQNIPFKKMTFSPANNPSPYMEASFSELNRRLLDKETVPVNALYRFSEIFRPLLNLNFYGEEEFRGVLFDIILHYLTIMDLRQGLNKHAFYMLFFSYDIETGVYGEEFVSVLKSFSAMDRAWILSTVVKVYEVGVSLDLFHFLMRKLYPESLIYFYVENAQQVLIYIGKRETELRWKQIRFLCEQFLTVDMRPTIYFTHHFGLIGYEETMYPDDMMIF